MKEKRIIAFLAESRDSTGREFLPVKARINRRINRITDKYGTGRLKPKMPYVVAKDRILAEVGRMMQDSG